jgi:hypothetical protein
MGAMGDRGDSNLETYTLRDRECLPAKPTSCPRILSRVVDTQSADSGRILAVRAQAIQVAHASHADYSTSVC